MGAETSRSVAPHARLAGRAARAAGSVAGHSLDSNAMQYTPRGFTIVELITVVVLLGVLSMVAMSRMVRPSAFAPGIVAHALVAETRFAQQLAASRRDALVTLTIDRQGADWRFRHATSVDGVVRTELVGADNTTVDVASGAAVGAVAAAAPLVMMFDAMGNVTAVTLGATAGDPNAGVALTVTGDSSRDVCVYPTGYAADEACA